MRLGKLSHVIVLYVGLNVNIMAYDAGLLAATSNAINNAGNIAFASSVNRSSRKFTREMYWMQRADALADWNAQNEYNSPAAQMERLRAAGLNPNLVYGHGSIGESGAIRGSSPTSMNFKTPDLDFQNGIGSYLDAQLKTQQLDNLKAQNTVITNEAILRAAQVDATIAGTDSTRIGTERKSFDLGLAGELRNTSLEMANAQLQKVRVDTSVALDANERAMLTNNMSLKEAAERILNSRQSRSESVQRISNMKDAQVGLVQDNMTKVAIRNLTNKDVELRQLDINLKRLGLQPSDELWQRILGRLLSGYSIDDVMKTLGVPTKGKKIPSAE